VEQEISKKGQVSGRTEVGGRRNSPPSFLIRREGKSLLTRQKILLIMQKGIPSSLFSSA